MDGKIDARIDSYFGFAVRCRHTLDVLVPEELMVDKESNEGREEMAHRVAAKSQAERDEGKQEDDMMVV